MSQLPTRADIDDQCKWNLSTIFDSVEEWEQEWTAVHDRLDDLRQYEGHITPDGETLLDALELFEEILRRKQRLKLYAQLKRNEDIEDSTHQQRLHRANQLDQNVTKATTMVRREIQDAGHDTISQAIKTIDGLVEYEFFLEDILRMSAHTRSPEVEDLLADFTPLIEPPNRVYTALTNNDIQPQPVETPDGSEAKITGVNLDTHLRNQDRLFRRRAYQSVYGEYADVTNTIATAYADKVKAQVAFANARNYESVREMAFNKTSYPDTGLRVQLPTEVHDSLTAAVRDSLDPLHRYYERRKEILGVEELTAWDLDVPLTTVDEPTIPYEEARDHILAAVAPLGDAYQDQLAEFFESQRVDVYETQNKQNILGYAVSSYDTGSYLLLNYQNDVRSLAILAHELGHAMHTEYLRNAQRPVYATGPRPSEEVASHVHELLLAHHLLDVGEDALQKHMQSYLLNKLQGGLYGSTMHSLFTHEMYRVVEGGGELTCDRIEKIYIDLLAEFRAPMKRDTWAERGWLVGSHARLPYHYYQYALGVTGALRIVDQLFDGGLTPAEYHEFLRAGGTMHSVDAFKTLGLDIRSQEPFRRACSAVRDHVAELDTFDAR